MCNFPILLTSTRFFAAPIIMPLLIYYVLPLQQPLVNIFIACIFILFALTDFLDGFLARRSQQVTPLGKILDPIADKMFVEATLLALLAVGRIALVYVLIFVLREILVMGLRMIALENGQQIVVSYAGKLKTITQCCFIILVIFNSKTSVALYVQYSMLVLALVFTIVSMMLYIKKFIYIVK